MLTQRSSNTITIEGSESYESLRMEDKFKVDKEVPHNILPRNDSSSEQTHEEASIQGEWSSGMKEKESNWNTPYKPSLYDRISYPQSLKKPNQENQIIKFLEVSTMPQTYIPTIKAFSNCAYMLNLGRRKKGLRYRFRASLEPLEHLLISFVNNYCIFNDKKKISWSNY